MASLEGRAAWRQGRLPIRWFVGRRFLPPLAIQGSLAAAALVLYASATSSDMEHPLGYDLLAYLGAAERLLAGHRLYDAQWAAPGAFGLYLYPPVFALAIVPLALLPKMAALVLWMVLLAGAFVAAIALLPVSARVRWLTLLVAGTSLPILRGWALGQVGPLLLFLAAVGWRWLERPWVLGSSAALGALIKVQPGILLLWAALAGRWRALLGGAVVAGLLIAASMALLGGGVWLDYLGLLARIGGGALGVPYNVAVGALAYGAGSPVGVARALQLATMVGALALVVLAARRSEPAAGYLAAVAASQLISPLLWDHYAILLVLPVAYLLERGRWWPALLLPSFWLFWPVLYLLAFAAVLLALALERAPAGAGPLPTQPSRGRGILRA